MHVKILTPFKVAYEHEATSVTAPAVDGELTILDRHSNLFTQLVAGIIRVHTDAGEMFFSIGGGYLETDGRNTRILVSRALHQDELDEQAVLRAQSDAEKLVKDAPNEEDRQEALMTLHRSMLDMKVLEKARRVTGGKRRVQTAQ